MVWHRIQGLLLLLSLARISPAWSQPPADAHPGQLFLGTHPSEISFNFTSPETCCKRGAPVDNVTVAYHDRTPPTLRRWAQHEPDNQQLQQILKVYAAESSLPEAMLASGLSNHGNRARLRHVMDRLLRGQ